MKKLLAITLALVVALSLAVSASAAGLRGQNPPAAQYTSQGPIKGATGCILYEDFDSCASPEAAGFFATTQEKNSQSNDYGRPNCEIALSTERAHSGSRSLKVFHRNLVNDSENGLHTFIYKGTNDSNSLGALIAANYSGVSPQTDTYFFQAWVYTETPQTFMFQLQYGGTYELWAPNDDYYDVPANTWTLIGGYVQDGVTYYSCMLEDFASCGIYPPRAASTWTGLKATTRNKYQVHTWGDFYVDDIALWKVEDSNYLFNFNKETQRMEKAVIHDYTDYNPDVSYYYEENSDGSISVVAPAIIYYFDDDADGDADGDGETTMKDVLRIRKSIAGMGDDLDKSAADVDGDGNLTMKDVLLIRKYIAGLIKKRG